MRAYSIWALLKILVGIGIITILYNYVNVYNDPVLGLSFGFLGVFMIIWWASYYFFLFGYKMFTTLPKHVQSSMSYKLSLLLGLYAMINLSLVITGKWSTLVGVLLLIGFVFLLYVFMKDTKEPTFS